MGRTLSNYLPSVVLPAYIALVRTSWRSIGFAALLLLPGCASLPQPESPSGGTAETSRIVRTVAVAISHPRHKTIAGYARAALDTRAGQDGRLSVVGMTSLEAPELSDSYGTLVFQIRESSTSAASESPPAWGPQPPPAIACYSLEFGRWGWRDPNEVPRTVPCPDPATPIVPPTSAAEDTYDERPCYSGSDCSAGGG